MQRMHGTPCTFRWSDRDSNPESSACKADALPVWLPPRKVLLPHPLLRKRNESTNNEMVHVYKHIDNAILWDNIKNGVGYKKNPNRNNVDVPNTKDCSRPIGA